METVPSWVAYVVGIAAFFQIFASIATILILGVLFTTLKQMGKALVDTTNAVKGMVEQEIRKEMMPEITSTLKNVRVVSDDARANSKQVTITYGKES